MPQNRAVPLNVNDVHALFPFAACLGRGGWSDLSKESARRAVDCDGAQLGVGGLETASESESVAWGEVAEQRRAIKRRVAAGKCVVVGVCGR